MPVVSLEQPLLLFIKLGILVLKPPDHDFLVEVTILELADES
jgi:hypothetical protein